MRSQTYWILVAAAFAALLFFSVDKLTETPPTWFDEGVLIQVPMNDSRYGVEGIQVAPSEFAPATYVTGGFSFLKPVSWSFSLFGTGLLQARVVMVLFILAAAAALFSLLYLLHGRISALGALILLATFPPLYGQGKNVLGEVPGLFFLGAFLLSLHLIEKNSFKGAWHYALSGALLGLTVVTKPIFILLPLAFSLVLLLRHRQIIFSWRLIGIAAASALVPIAIWYVGRFSLEDSFSQLISYYANPYAVADIPSQVRENILRFFLEASPAYFGVVMGLWGTAFGLRLWRKEKISLAESTVFVFSLLVCAAYLRTPGWYRYFFLAEVPALAFAPYALLTISRSIWPAYRLFATAGAWIVLVIFLMLQLYQLFVGSWVAQHAERETTRILTERLGSFSHETTFFVYNTPAAVIFLPSPYYYQYLELNPSVQLGKDLMGHLADGSAELLITDHRRWDTSSSTLFSRYRFSDSVEGLVIARYEAQ